jgi:hypothetical protein
VICKKNRTSLKREAQASSQCLQILFKFKVREKKFAMTKRLSQNNVLKLNKLLCTPDQKRCLGSKKYLITKREILARMKFRIYLQ